MWYEGATEEDPASLWATHKTHLRTAAGINVLFCKMIVTTMKVSVVVPATNFTNPTTLLEVLRSILHIQFLTLTPYLVS